MNNDQLREYAVIFDAAITSNNESVIKALNHLITITKLAQVDYVYGDFERILDELEELKTTIPYSTITRLMNTQYGL